MRVPTVIIKSVDAAGVCSPQAILVCGLRTIGVPAYPNVQFAYTDLREEVPDPATGGSRPQRTQIWVLLDKTLDGKYTTKDLIAWWQDPQWHIDNPTHEWRHIHDALTNMAGMADQARKTTPLMVVRKGRLSAQIPVTASDLERNHLIDQLEGRIPVGTPLPRLPVANSSHSVVSAE